MVKLKFLCVLLLMGILPLCACSDALKSVESDFVIKVSGANGVKFSGHYSIVATGSSPKPINVAGSVPAEYQGKGVMALCLFQRKSSDGSLKIQIIKAGKVVAEGESAAPDAVIALKTPLPGSDNIIIQVFRKFLG